MNSRQAPKPGTRPRVVAAGLCSQVPLRDISKSIIAVFGSPPLEFIKNGSWGSCLDLTKGLWLEAIKIVHSSVEWRATSRWNDSNVSTHDIRIGVCRSKHESPVAAAAAVVVGAAGGGGGAGDSVSLSRHAILRSVTKVAFCGRFACLLLSNVF